MFHFLSHLLFSEAKLHRLKGQNEREVKPRDILQGLTDAKESHMRGIVQTSEPSIFQEECLESSEGSTIAAIQRRLYPERQALTTDELKHLVENDNLGEQHQENSEEEKRVIENSTNTDSNSVSGDDKGDNDVKIDIQR